MKLNLLFLPFLFFTANISFSQEVYQNVSSTIYEFIDELANDGIISVNSVIKPYSRIFIAEKLQEAAKEKNQLSIRQQQEIDFYLPDFNRELNGFETTDFIGKNLISKNKIPFKKRIDL